MLSVYILGFIVYLCTIYLQKIGFYSLKGGETKKPKNRRPVSLLFQVHVIPLLIGALHFFSRGLENWLPTVVHFVVLSTYIILSIAIVKHIFYILAHKRNTYTDVWSIDMDQARVYYILAIILFSVSFFFEWSVLTWIPLVFLIYGFINKVGAEDALKANEQRAYIERLEEENKQLRRKLSKNKG